MALLNLLAYLRRVELDIMLSDTLDTMDKTIEAVSKVRAIRESLGLTQVAMAEKMGCSLSALRRYEYDNALPGTLAGKKAMAALAKKTGVALDGAK